MPIATRKQREQLWLDSLMCRGHRISEAEPDSCRFCARRQRERLQGLSALPGLTRVLQLLFNVMTVFSLTEMTLSIINAGQRVELTYGPFSLVIARVC